MTAQGIAEKCEKVLFADSRQALSDQVEGKLSLAFENIIEANTLLSGLGFESGGLAAAHAIHNGLSILGEEMTGVSHGRKVAYGILIHLILIEAPENELKRYLDFYAELGLPRNFKELSNIALTEEVKEKIAQQATIPSETIHYLAGDQTTLTVKLALDKLEQMFI